MGTLNAALAQLITSTWATANGSPTPLGVTHIDADQTYNFAIYSKNSTRVRLLLFSAVCNTAALLLPYFVRALPAFYVAAAMSGLALAFFHVTLQNVIGLLSKPADRPRNFSNFSLMGAVTNFVGPLFAGFAIDKNRL